MSLEIYVIEKLDARIDAQAREIGALQQQVKELKEQVASIDDDYVDTDWFSKILAKLHPETNEGDWFGDI